MGGGLTTRKLKTNRRFTPCPIDDEDELYPNGIFVFNITKMAGKRSQGINGREQSKQGLACSL